MFSRRALRRVISALDMGNICARPHYKQLPIGHVPALLRDFQPELHFLPDPAMTPLRRRAHLMRLPFYAGEVLVTAVKRQQGGAGTPAGC